MIFLKKLALLKYFYYLCKKTMDEYYLKNKEKMNKRSSEYQKQKRKDDYIFKMKCNLRRRVRNMKLTNKPSTLEILGADYQTVSKHIELSFKEGMSWSNYGSWHIDHKIPLNSAKTELDKINLMHYKNLQALWAKENVSKGFKII